MTRAVLQRRTVLKWGTAPVVLAMLGGCQAPPRVYDLNVSRDEGCPCCHVWAEQMEATGRFRLNLVDTPDLPAYKRSLKVPAGLGSCHTTLVDGLVVEGHVPAEDILRLLAEKPRGVIGIAVPGMPRGSPGMEQPNGVVDSYKVIAFDAQGGQSDFSFHAGNT
jgi:hypothetical protein